MTQANRLLIRWQNGWYEVTDTTGFTPDMFVGTSEGLFNYELWVDAPVHREAMLSLGSQQDVATIRRIGFDQLGIFANPRTEISCDVAPVDPADTPYLGYRPGDKITVPDIDGTPTLERVMAITVTENEDGEPSYATELKDVILTEQERWKTAVDKMANGSVAGESNVASPPTHGTRYNRNPQSQGTWNITGSASGTVSGSVGAGSVSSGWRSDVVARALTFTASGTPAHSDIPARVSFEAYTSDVDEETFGIIDLSAGSPQTIAMPVTIGAGLHYRFRWVEFGTTQSVSGLALGVTLQGNHGPVALTWGGGAM